MSNDNEIQRNVFLGLGIALGAGLTLIAHSLWTITGGPAKERVVEFFDGPQGDFKVSDPPKTDASPDDEARLERWRTATNNMAAGGTLRVLISDQHIDTWAKLELYAGKANEKQQHYLKMPRRAVDFIEFLKTLRALAELEDASKKPLYQSVELYINGDLTDVPLHAAHTGRDEPDEMVFDEALAGVLVKGETWQGVLPKALDDMLRELRSIVRDEDPRLRIFYFTGNHDIGIGGLRYFRPGVLRNMPTSTSLEAEILDLPAHVMWNPGGIIKPGSGKPDEKWVYIEHGHMHDPILWLYMRYAVFDLLRGGFRHQERRLLGRLQRGGKAGQNAHDGPTLNAEEENPPGQNRFKDFSVALVKLRYRHAARRTAQWLNKLYPCRPFTIVFGHTHIEDKAAFEVNGTEYTYINAGSWAGNQPHQTFWIIEPSGNVAGPFQW